VDALAARIADARAELARLEAQYHERENAAWLKVIAISTRGLAFTSPELVQHAHVDPDLAAALPTLSARRIGRRLQMLIGRTWDGWSVECTCHERHGRLWKIDFHTVPSNGDGDTV